MAGLRFGRLLVITAADKSQDGHLRWSCRCDCGNHCTVLGKYLRNGRTRSCGCFHREQSAKLNRTHGMSRSLTWQSWAAMLTRCYNPKQQAYKKYGALGVKVCERWRTSFPNFLADMGVRPSKDATLDRISPFGDYEPNNCQWATKSHQAINQRRQLALRLLTEADPSWPGKIAKGLKLKVEFFEEGYTRI